MSSSNKHRSGMRRSDTRNLNSQSKRIGASRSRLGGTRASQSSSRAGNHGTNVVWHKDKVATPQSLVSARADGPPVSKRFSQQNRSQMSGGPSSHSHGSEGNVMDRLSSGFSRSGLSTRSRDSAAASDEDDGYDLASPLIDDGGDDDADLDTKGTTTVLELSDDELEATVTLKLQETETMTLLHIPGVRVQKDSQEEKAVMETNATYEEFKASHGKDADVYFQRHTQTFNFELKNKEVMAAPPATKDSGSMATTWDIHDSYKQEEEGLLGDGEELDAKEASKDGMTDLERDIDTVVAAALASPGCLLDAEGAVRINPTESSRGSTSKRHHKHSRSNHGNHGSGSRSRSGLGAGASRSRANHSTSSSSKNNNDSRMSNSRSSAAGHSSAGSQAGESGWGDAAEGADIMVARESSRVLSSRALLLSLRTVERAIQQNSYHSRHRLYRAVPGSEAELEKAKADAKLREAAAAGDLGALTADVVAVEEPKERLEKLWSYMCPLTAGRNVSCMVWNKVNKDLLAVSYGQFDFTDQADGLIAFWSMKNPDYPECVLRTPAGVTTLDFSEEHPNLLAAGMYNGTVCIYDVRKAMAGETDGTPAMASAPLSGHTDAVWQVRWVSQGERGERLVSVSTDGRVKVWSMKKGLTCNDLMVLKRVRNPVAAPEEKGDGVISRVASGLCIDFPETDTSIYYAGTEDGVIHKCSVSYNEQDLDHYTAHAGPVNKFRCSPFVPHVALSCSADWSVKLWNMHNADSEAANLTFQTTDVADGVSDVNWSPMRSTLFASVTGDGKVQVWDASTLNPVISLQVFDDPASDPHGEAGGVGAGAGEYVDPKSKQPKKLSSVLFALNAPVLVTGDNTGRVDVYRMLGVDLTPASKDEQCDRLMRAINPDTAGVMGK